MASMNIHCHDVPKVVVDKSDSGWMSISIREDRDYVDIYLSDSAAEKLYWQLSTWMQDRTVVDDDGVDMRILQDEVAGQS